MGRVSWLGLDLDRVAVGVGTRVEAIGLAPDPTRESTDIEAGPIVVRRCGRGLQHHVGRVCDRAAANRCDDRKPLS